MFSLVICITIPSFVLLIQSARFDQNMSQIKPTTLDMSSFHSTQSLSFVFFILNLFSLISKHCMFLNFGFSHLVCLFCLFFNFQQCCYFLLKGRLQLELLLSHLTLSEMIHFIMCFERFKTIVTILNKKFYCHIGMESDSTYMEVTTEHMNNHYYDIDPSVDQ